jgi:hypothetical protein
MSIKNIIYWVSTFLICFLMAYSAYGDLTNNQAFVQGMQHLGYPQYLLGFLGVAKIGAIIVLLIPKKMLIKHWAYAGIVFDLAGASYSHFKSGDAMQDTLVPLFAILIAFVSYFMYLKRVGEIT